MVLDRGGRTVTGWSFLAALGLAKLLPSYAHQAGNGGLQEVLLGREGAVAMEGRDEGESRVFVRVDLPNQAGEFVVLFSVAADPGFE
jgi:hypothetical protein